MKQYNLNELILMAKGGTGSIYRINDEQVLKVYGPDTTLEELEQKKETMITFEIVSVGNSYGIVLEMLKGILVYGIPTATQRLSSTLRTFALNKLLLVIAGSMAVTALSVQSNMYNIFASVGVGLSLTTLTFTGVLVGERNQDGLRKLMKTSLSAAIILNSIVMIVLYAAAPFFVHMYLGNNLDAYESCLIAVRLFALSLPFHAVSNVYVSYFQG